MKKIAFSIVVFLLAFKSVDADVVGCLPPFDSNAVTLAELDGGNTSFSIVSNGVGWGVFTACMLQPSGTAVGQVVQARVTKTPSGPLCFMKVYTPVRSLWIMVHKFSTVEACLGGCAQASFEKVIAGNISASSIYSAIRDYNSGVAF